MHPNTHIRPGAVDLAGPAPAIGFWRRARLRSAGLRDRIRRTEADAEHHTAYTRWLLHDAALRDVHASLWAEDRIRPLAVEAAGVRERLVAGAPAAPAAVVADQPDGTDARRRVLWAQDTRLSAAARTEHGRARAAFAADRDRLAQIRAEIAAIESHAIQVRREWAERFRQEAAFYTHVRSRRGVPQASPLPAYPAVEPVDGPGAVDRRRAPSAVQEHEPEHRVPPAVAASLGEQNHRALPVTRTPQN